MATRHATKHLKTPNCFPHGSSEYLAWVETRWRGCRLPLFLPPPLLQRSHFCIVKLHPVQKCSGKTVAALWAGEYPFSWFRLFRQCFWSRCCGITVNDPELKALAASPLQCCSDFWLEYWRLKTWAQTIPSRTPRLFFYSIILQNLFRNFLALLYFVDAIPNPGTVSQSSLLDGIWTEAPKQHGG